MGRALRAVVTASLSTALAVTVLVSPVARAQDMPFCAILSAAEVSAAVGADVAPTYGDDRSCNYASAAQDVFTSLSITNGGTTMDIAKSVYTDGEDISVSGQPAYLHVSDFDSLLWIERGDGDTLSFQLLAPPSGLDPKVALQGLGELAFPRLATLAIPTPTPAVVIQQDAELAALFPTEIGGAPVTVQTMVQGLTMDPAQQAQVEELLASQGKTLADVSLGFAYSVDPSYNITALRVRGADVSAFVGPFLAMSGANGSPTPAQVAGKDVTVVSLSNGTTPHVYPKDDVIWLVSAEEPILTEVFQKLP